MAKKLKFGDDGEVKEEIQGQKPELPSEVKKKSKGNRIEKRRKLTVKKVQLEKSYHEKQFGAAEEKETETLVAQKSEEETDSAKKNEVPPASQNSKARDQALEYLMAFINSKDQWKFQKVRQTWILRNLYYQHEIDNEHFKHALNYMKNMGDRAKKETIAEAKGLLEGSFQDGAIEITDTIRKRAKKIIKLL